VSLRRAVIHRVVAAVVRLLCDIDSREFVEALASRGPALLVINHINFLEIPILVTQAYPRWLTGIVKVETWKNPVFAFLFNAYKAIPLDRHGAYLDVFRRVRAALEEGAFVAIAPEGTRSGDGVLRPAKAGIIQLALLTGAPILPVAHYGGERIWDNMKRLKRTPFHFRVGRPFRFVVQGRPDKQTRQEMLDELMGQLARLLPEDKRGPYAGEALRESRRLEFL